MPVLNAGDEPGESEFSHGKGIGASQRQRDQLTNEAGDEMYSAYERLRMEHRANTEENSLDAEYEADPDYYSRED